MTTKTLPSLSYENTGRRVGKLVDEKNAAYGNSFSQSEEFLRLLYPKGISTHQYKDVLAIIRIFDKMKRIATNNDPFGENPWLDIAGYAILMCALEGKIAATDDLPRWNRGEPSPSARIGQAEWEHVFISADYDDHSGAPR